MPGLRIALFVEGGDEPPLPHRRRPLEVIWNEHLPQALGLQPFELIVPISKKHLVVLDPGALRHKPSGSGEALDQLMVRMMKRNPFDAAVVVWDLVPAWNKDGAPQRQTTTPCL